MNENIEVLNVSSIKPIIDGLEPQEVVDVNEEEWNKDAVINMSIIKKKKKKILIYFLIIYQLM